MVRSSPWPLSVRAAGPAGRHKREPWMGGSSHQCPPALPGTQLSRSDSSVQGPALLLRVAREGLQSQAIWRLARLCLLFWSLAGLGASQMEAGLWGSWPRSHTAATPIVQCEKEVPHKLDTMMPTSPGLCWCLRQVCEYIDHSRAKPSLKVIASV